MCILFISNQAHLSPAAYKHGVCVQRTLDGQVCTLCLQARLSVTRLPPPPPPPPPHPPPPPPPCPPSPPLLSLQKYQCNCDNEEDRQQLKNFLNDSIEEV